MQIKEIAKFAAGVTAWETIVHIALVPSGLLPITWFGFTITPTINTVQIILSAVTTILLIYYAWFRK